MTLFWAIFWQTDFSHKNSDRTQAMSYKELLTTLGSLSLETKGLYRVL